MSESFGNFSILHFIAYYYYTIWFNIGSLADRMPAAAWDVEMTNCCQLHKNVHVSIVGEINRLIDRSTNVFVIVITANAFRWCNNDSAISRHGVMRLTRDNRQFWMLLRFWIFFSFADKYILVSCRRNNSFSIDYSASRAKATVFLINVLHIYLTGNGTGKISACAQNPKKKALTPHDRFWVFINQFSILSFLCNLYADADTAIDGNSSQ